MSFKINLENETLKNKSYRKVIFTDNNTQVVLMSIPPNDYIDREIHKNTTQFIRIEKGSCVAYIEEYQYRLKSGDAIVIPKGHEHYIKNTGKIPLKLYTIYSPPEHPKDLVQNFHVHF